MAGTKIGGLKAAQRNKERYGENYYRNIGKQGGSVAGKPKGFAYAAANGLTWHKEAGSKGGSISRRGKTPGTPVTASPTQAKHWYDNLIGRKQDGRT